MLQNEKYAGDVLLQKTYTADFLEKKVKKNRGEVKQYYITDNHPAIIPRDIFQEVQLEIARRSSKERFLAGGQSLVEENIPANMHYRKEPFVGNVVLCIVEPCGSNGTERRKMYGDA